MNTELRKLMDCLKFSGMSKCLDQVLAQLDHAEISCQEALQTLLSAEFSERQEKSLENRIKHAKLPWTWDLSSFPFEQQTSVNHVQINQLARLEFIERSSNLIFIGPPGTGKTGLAIGLLRQAIIEGYRCRFYDADDLLNILYASLADRTTNRLMKQLYNYDCLLIDKLGYLDMTEEKINLLFKLIDMRYRKKSTIITTHLDYDAWYGAFKKRELVDAMLDRLRHFCVTLRINGPSLRASVKDDLADIAKVSEEEKENHE